MIEFRRRTFDARFFITSVKSASLPVIATARMSCANLTTAARLRAKERPPSSLPLCVAPLNINDSGANVVAAATVYQGPGGVLGGAHASAGGSTLARRPAFIVPQGGTGVSLDNCRVGKIGGCQQAAEEISTVAAFEQLHKALSCWRGCEAANEECVSQLLSSGITNTDGEAVKGSREELLTALVCVLEKDPSFGPRLLSGLENDTLRMLLLFGTAQEYFGHEEVEKQLSKVDAEREDCVSAEEYSAWVEFALRECADARKEARESCKKQQRPHLAPTRPPTATAASGYITWNLWLRIAYSASVPFMAFGILDNSIFVTAGDAIDRRCAEAFGLTSMAAAALGGVVSGVAGVQMHGVAERFTQRVHLVRVPDLTSEQRKSESRGNATRVGNTVGMLVGLLLGMIPLLFVHPSNFRDGIGPQAEDRY